MDGRAYSEVHAFVLGLGGTMTWRAGGQGGGGTWSILLRGRELLVPMVPSPSRDVGLLDSLYVEKPRVKPPETWDKASWESTLVKEAFWVLVTAPGWKPVS